MTGVVNLVSGTPFDDDFENSLEGTPACDLIEGFEGNDWLSGSPGNDTLDGGAGTDSVFYDPPEFMPDGVFVNISGGGVVDTWNGVEVSVQDGYVLSGIGVDEIVDIEEIFTSSGSDIVYAGDISGSYPVIGDGAGDDLIVVVATGSTVEESYGFYAGSGNDTYIGSSNPFDFVDYEFGKYGDIAGPHTQGAVVSFHNVTDSTATDPWGDTDTITDVLNFHGSNMDDDLSGSDLSNTLRGRRGEDLIQGHGSHDLLSGDHGNDTILGGTGDDLIYGGRGDDDLFGGSGFDEIRGGADADFMDGDDGNDAMYGGNGSDSLLGSEGEDTLKGGSGSDTLDGASSDGGTKERDVLNGGRISPGVLDGASDVFRFREDWGRDVVQNFEAGPVAAGGDVLDFSLNSEVNSIADLTITTNAKGFTVVREAADPDNMIVVRTTIPLSATDDFGF